MNLSIALWESVKLSRLGSSERMTMTMVMLLATHFFVSSVLSNQVKFNLTFLVCYSARRLVQLDLLVILSRKDICIVRLDLNDIYISCILKDIKRSCKYVLVCFCMPYLIVVVIVISTICSFNSCGGITIFASCSMKTQLIYQTRSSPASLIYFFAYVFYKRYKSDVFHKKCGRSPLKTSLSFGKSYSFLFLLFIFSFLVNLFNTTHSIQQSVKEAIEQVQVEIKANHTALLVNLLFT